jgi:hypothetical protein
MKIHFLDLFGFDVIIGFEVGHFAGDARRERVGVETANLTDA